MSNLFSTGPNPVQCLDRIGAHEMFTDYMDDRFGGHCIQFSFLCSVPSVDWPREVLREQLKYVFQALSFLLPLLLVLGLWVILMLVNNM